MKKKRKRSKSKKLVAKLKRSLSRDEKETGRQLPELQMA
jgi:hypothetical protein